MKRLLVWLSLGAAACDPSEPTPYVPVYDPASSEPVALLEFCGQLARNTCAVLRPCCQSGPFAFDEAKCVAAARQQCEVRRVRSLEAGLVYDDVQAGRCARGTAILFPGCRTPTDDPIAADVIEACRNAFHGTRRVGEDCDGRHAVECAPPALGVRVACELGRCRERPVLRGGDECDARPGDCAAGLVCDPSLEPRRCTARWHAEGAPCVPAQNRCDASADLYCDLELPRPVCAKRPGKGAACVPAIGCARPFRCDAARSGGNECTDAKDPFEPCNEHGECASGLCAGTSVKACLPSGIGPPIAPLGAATGDPHGYVARIAAACSGVIPDGAGSLAPFVVPATE